MTSGTRKKRRVHSRVWVNPNGMYNQLQLWRLFYYLGPGYPKDFLDFISVFQPYAELVDDSKDLRKAGFKYCDGNGNGICILTEVNSFIISRICAIYKGNGKDPGKINMVKGVELYQTFYPRFIQAFNGAKALGNKNCDSNYNDYIYFSEFRILNVHLCMYAGAIDAFIAVDVSFTVGDKTSNNRSCTK